MAFHDAPAVLRFNPHVRTGYRAGCSSYARCLCSVLELHNETGNIVSHLVPALLGLAAVASGARPWEGAAAAWWANVVSTLLCFAASVAYHTCLPVTSTYHRFLKLDVSFQQRQRQAGVGVKSWSALDTVNGSESPPGGLQVLAVLGVLVLGGHTQLAWGLHCAPGLRAAFLCLYHLVGLGCVHAALTAATPLRRAAPMGVLLLIRLASLAARLAIGQGGGGLRHYLWMEGLSLAGGVINAARLPERWLQPADRRAPAPLDLVANSHQIMHVMVAGALWLLHRGLEADSRVLAALRAGAAVCL